MENEQDFERRVRLRLIELCGPAAENAELSGVVTEPSGVYVRTKLRDRGGLHPDSDLLVSAPKQKRLTFRLGGTSTVSDQLVSRSIIVLTTQEGEIVDIIEAR